MEFRAVLRALVAKKLYTWKDDLSQAENQDKIDAKVVNMRKKFVSHEISHNSTTTTATKRQRETEDREAVLGGFANAKQLVRVNVRRKTYLVRRDCVDLVKTLALHGESVDATWAEDFSALIKFATDKSRDGAVRDDHLRGTTRENQQMRAETINRRGCQ